MRYLRNFKESVVDEDYINKMCGHYGIINYSINNDGLVDVDGDVVIHSPYLKKMPISFGEVTGKFEMHGIFETLEGCPKVVGGDFSFFDCEVNSLEFGPTIVGGNYNCSNNNLTSLLGAPKEIGGISFRLISNKIEELKHISSGSNLRFVSAFNNNLYSINGLPETVEDIDILGNPIFKYWDQVRNFDKLEVFLFSDIDTRDGDRLCQQKVDFILKDINI